MTRIFSRYLLLGLLFLLQQQSGYGQPKRTWQQAANDPEHLHAALQKITEVMVHDIYAPPVAARAYAYISAAAYEGAITNDTAYNTLAGQVNGLAPIIKATTTATCTGLVSVHALLEVAKKILISEKDLDQFHQQYLRKVKATGIPEQIYTHSIRQGNAIARQVIEWSRTDRYAETRTWPKLTVEENAATWKPTPPVYMRAVEPNWGALRPFLLDSASQFKPEAPASFDTARGSSFYRQAWAVYQAGKNINPAEQAIADFWDCNPFKMNIRGHVMFASKKISPGGHWMHITTIACRKTEASLSRSAAAYVTVALAIADGFISCWDEKYRSNLIRPESYITQYIDPNWTPVLQTPPFPEYTSGHSVISQAAALVLGRFFGTSFAFVDDTEKPFGLPARSFKSFEEAANEAAVSRFYGGIHYMPAIANGLRQGAAIGEWATRKLATEKTARAANLPLVRKD